MPRMRSSASAGIGLCLAMCAAAFSCRSSVEPRSGVTLLVTNETCVLGRCDSLLVLGFPANGPNSPGGPWSITIGIMVTRQACFTLPPSSTFRFIGVHNDGSADTVAYTWTTADSLSLGAQPPSWSRFQAYPSTDPFVPAGAAGWRVNFPSGMQAAPRSPC